MPQIVPSRALGLADAAAPGNRITVGLIGTGSHGIHRDLNGFLAEEDAQVVAVCDVDSNHRQRGRKLAEAHYARATAQGTYKGCAAYNDFREIIARPDIDAVCNATPDHWHAIPSIMAVRAGKDVICEKPLPLTSAAPEPPGSHRTRLHLRRFGRTSRIPKNSASRSAVARYRSRCSLTNR